MTESVPFSLSIISTEFDGVAFEGVPVVLRDSAMQIEFLPSEFLVYNAVVRGRSSSALTWKAQGHIMVPFLNFMSARGLDWRSPTEEQLAAAISLVPRESEARARPHSTNYEFRL